MQQNYITKEKAKPIFILATILLIVLLGALYDINYQNKILSNKNAEYLSVIEEYSVEYAELEDKIKTYKEKVEDYKSQIKDYKAQIKNYEEKLATTTKATTNKKLTTTKKTSYNTNSFVGNITAYCGCSKCCGKWATNNSVKYGASGMKLISGYSVASDYYAMGTILYIEGYGKVQVADRFGAGHGKSKIDIYFDSHSRALQWGRQYRNVSVVS